LWKIQNFTEGGTWVTQLVDTTWTKSGLVFDPPFSIQPGVTVPEKVEGFLGPPDTITSDGSETVFAYHRRQIQVRFDARGRVKLLSMKTGASGSGVKVGSPVALWEMVYGPQAEVDEDVKDRLLYVCRNGKVSEIIYTASGNEPAGLTDCR
jgi:hypothetical protein